MGNDSSTYVQQKVAIVPTGNGNFGSGYVLIEKDFLINILKTLEAIKRQVHMRLDNKV